MCDNSRRHSCASRMQIKVVTREIPLVLKWMRGIFIFRIQIHLIRRKIMTIYDELVARGLIAQVTDEKKSKSL